MVRTLSSLATPASLLRRRRRRRLVLDRFIELHELFLLVPLPFISMLLDERLARFLLPHLALDLAEVGEVAADPLLHFARQLLLRDLVDSLGHPHAFGPGELGEIRARHSLEDLVDLAERLISDLRVLDLGIDDRE